MRLDEFAAATAMSLSGLALAAGSFRIVTASGCVTDGRWTAALADLGQSGGCLAVAAALAYVAVGISARNVHS